MEEEYDYNDCVIGYVEIEGYGYEASYRYGKHPNKGGFKQCLKLNSNSPFSDDKYGVTAFDKQSDGTFLVRMYGFRLASTVHKTIGKPYLCYRFVEFYDRRKNKNVF